jgi:hypothetical protein
LVRNLKVSSTARADVRVTKQHNRVTKRDLPPSHGRASLPEFLRVLQNSSGYYRLHRKRPEERCADVPDSHRKPVPISLRVDDDAWTVYVTVTGPVTPAEVAEAMESARQDPHMSPTMFRLVDCRAATIGLSGDEIRELAFTYAKNGIDPSLRIAVVLSTDVAVGLARMFAGYAALPAEVFAVFRDIGEAREWLGIDPVKPG